MSKIQTIALSPETATQAAKLMVAGAKGVEAARVTMLLKLTEACRLIGMPMSAAQYDKQVAPYIRTAFSQAAKGRNAVITEATAGKYASKLKTGMLAVLNGVATPNAGESFWDFYDRAAKLLPDARMADGSPVWEAGKKKGRPVGFKAPAKPGSVKPGAAAQADASVSLSEPATGSAKLAAARILADGNEARATRILEALTAYAAEFDKWAATILDERKPATLKAGEPATAMAEALAAAAEKKSQAPKRKAA